MAWNFHRKYLLLWKFVLPSSGPYPGMQLFPVAESLAPGGENAAIIGSITTQFPGRAVLKTVFGAHRVLSKLSGAQLPRIC